MAASSDTFHEAPSTDFAPAIENISMAWSGPVAAESMEPTVFRVTAILRDRLSELQKRHLIRADADLDAASLIVSGQSLHISFLLRVNTNLQDAQLRHLISEFAGLMARGLARYEQERMVR